MKTPFASKIALFATTALLLNNCSGPAYPPCDDPTVLGLADELIRDKLWEAQISNYARGAIGQVTYDYLVQRSDQEVAELSERISALPELEQELAQLKATDPEDSFGIDMLQSEIDIMRERMANAELEAEQLSALPDIVDAAKLTHSLIRTQDFNEQIRKSSCVSQVNIQFQNPRTGEPVSNDAQFIYTAQFTDDGSEVYVEGRIM